MAKVRFANSALKESHRKINKLSEKVIIIEGIEIFIDKSNDILIPETKNNNFFNISQQSPINTRNDITDIDHLNNSNNNIAQCFYKLFHLFHFPLISS